MLLGLGVAVIVIALTKKKSVEEPQSEVEQLLNQFIDEMESENERLMSTISNQTENMNKEFVNRDKKIEKLTAQIALLQQQIEQVNGLLLNNGQEHQKSKPIAQRYRDLFEKLDQGISIDEIAKTTGMGKGEIQLILQLAKEEEKR